MYASIKGVVSLLDCIWKYLQGYLGDAGCLKGASDICMHELRAMLLVTSEDIEPYVNHNGPHYP